MKHYNLLGLASVLALVWGCGGEARGLEEGEEEFLPIELSLPDAPEDTESPWLVAGLDVEGTRVEFVGLPLDGRSSIMMRVSGTGEGVNPVAEVQAGSPDVPLTYAEIFGGLTDHLVDLPADLGVFHFIQADNLGRGYPFIEATRTAIEPVATVREKARGFFSVAFDQAFDTAVPAFRQTQQRDSAMAQTLNAFNNGTFQYVVYGCTGYNGSVSPFYAHTAGAVFPGANTCPKRTEWIRIGIQNVNWETDNPQAYQVVQWFGPTTTGAIRSMAPFTSNPGSWHIFDWADPALKFQAISAHRGTNSPQTIARFRTAIYVPR